MNNKPMNFGLPNIRLIHIFPLITTLLLLITTFFGAYQYESREKNLIETAIQDKANELSNILSTDLNIRFHFLQRMTQYWYAHHYDDKAHFELVAANHLEDLPGFQALEWVDHDYYVRWIVPMQGNQKAINLYLGFEPKRLEALNLARANSEPSVTLPINLVQGGKGFLTYFPVTLQGEFKGFLLAVFRAESWFKYIYPDRILSDRDFKLDIKINNIDLYTADSLTETADHSWAKSSAGLIGEHGCKITITPTKTYIIKHTSSISMIIQFIGTLISLMAGGLIFYILKARRDTYKTTKLTHQISEINHSLEDKIQEQTEQLRIRNLELEKLAQIDSLTNIANRPRFDDALEASIKRCHRYQNPFSLLIIDLDCFKEVNNTYGQEVGDRYLIEIAKLLATSVHRVDDMAARFGNEEFALILSGTDQEGAMVIAESIRNSVMALRLDNPNSKVEPYLTVSIGIATAAPDSYFTSAELVSKSIAALYSAKQNGRNKVSPYSSSVG